MIRSFKEKRAERLARDDSVKAFEPFSAKAKQQLARLAAALSLQDLSAIRGNRLDALKGDRAGQHSIRINDQWRICFVWDDRARCAEQVEIVDYH